MTDNTDPLILQDVARYRVLLLAFIASSHFDGDAEKAARAAERLKNLGMVRYHHFKDKKYPAYDGLSFLSCTPKGARSAGKKDRSKPFGPEAREEAVAVSFFCFASRTKRYRLELAELKPFLGSYKPSANVPFVLAVERGDEPVIYRCYLTKLSVDDAFEKTVALVADMNAHTDLRPLVEARQLGAAVLCPTKTFCKSLNERFRARVAGNPSLLQLARVGSFLGPQAASISREVADWEAEWQTS